MYIFKSDFFRSFYLPKCTVLNIYGSKKKSTNIFLNIKKKHIKNGNHGLFLKQSILREIYSERKKFHLFISFSKAKDRVYII